MRGVRKHCSTEISHVINNVNDTAADKACSDGVMTDSVTARLSSYFKLDLLMGTVCLYIRHLMEEWMCNVYSDVCKRDMWLDFLPLK